MIITRSWISLFMPLETLDDKEIIKTLIRIGHEVASVKKIWFDDQIVIGKVLDVQSHPSADKLHICKVDIAKKTLQIVCGASNVAAGQFVAVAQIGTVMPSGLSINEVQLRGVDSFGMICSAAELGLPALNDGILPLDSSIGALLIGKKLNSYTAIADTIFEVELTANRGDCLSVYGLARDLSAALDQPLFSEKPDPYNESAKGIGRVLRLISDQSATASLMIKVIENKGILLPLAARLRLAFADIKTTNNINALAAYATHSVGVLFRAFDISAFCARGEEHGEIRLTKRSGVNVLLGNGVEIDRIGLSANDDFLATNESKTIVLEAFCVPPEEISLVAYEQKLKGDLLHQKACKGSEMELSRGMRFFQDLLGGEGECIFYAEALSYEPRKQPSTIAINTEAVSALIGQTIDKNKTVVLLKRLGCSVHSNGDQRGFLVTPPAYRHDLQNAADLTEEVVRMVGIDRIESKPLMMPQKRSVSEGYKAFANERKLAERAAANGFNESLHFLFCDSATVEFFGFSPMKKELAVANPISAQLDALRPTVLINLIEAAAKNRAKSKPLIALFEIGDVYNAQRSHTREIGFVFSGDKEAGRVENHGKSQAETLFNFARKIAAVIGDFELRNETTSRYFQSGHSAGVYMRGVRVGEAGKISSLITRKYDLDATFAAHIDLALIGTKRYNAKPISKLQSVTRDLSVVISKQVRFEQVRQAISDLNIELLAQLSAVDIYSDDSLGNDHSLTLRFVFQPFNNSLNDEDIAALVGQILAKLTADFGAKLR